MAGLTNVMVTFAPAPAEGSSWDFLLRALWDAPKPDSETATATFQFGLIPPLVQSRQTAQGQDLFWFSHSVLAQQVRIDRTLRDGGEDADPQGPWSTLAILPASTLEYVDTSAEEDVLYGYRVQLLAGNLQSIPVVVTPSVLPVKAPVDFHIQPHPRSGALLWTNVSQVAAELFLERFGSGPGTVELPPTTASYEDVVAPGCYAYQLQVTGTYGYASRNQTDWVPLVTTSAGGAFSLATSLLLRPQANGILPDRDGGWVFLEAQADAGVANPDAVLLSSGQAAWSPSPPLVGTEFFTPSLLVDSRGFPHAVFLRSGASATTDVVHSWYDGQNWQTEVIATRDWTAEGVAFELPFAIDASDQLHVLWATEQASSSLEYAFRGVSGWTVEPLNAVASPASTPEILVDFRLAVEPDGSAHVIYGQDGTWHLQRSQAGIWSREAVPISVWWVSGHLAAVAPAGGTLVVVFDATPGDPSMRAVHGISGTAGQWTAEQSLLEEAAPSTPWARPLLTLTQLGAAAVVERTMFQFDGTAWTSADLGGCDWGADFLFEGSNGAPVLIEQSLTETPYVVSSQAWYSLHSVSPDPSP